MAFDENLFIERGEVIHRLAVTALHLGKSFDGRTNRLQRFDAVGLLGVTRERPVLHVARQTHAAGEHDPAVWTFALARFGRAADMFHDTHLAVLSSVICARKAFTS